MWLRGGLTLATALVGVGLLQPAPPALDRLTDADLVTPPPTVPDDPRPLTPADSVVSAARDIALLPESIQRYTRYLSLYNVPTKYRWTVLRVLNGHINGLSREPEIVPLYKDLALVDRQLLRINLQDYRISPDLWETLADAQPNGEPYYHVVLDDEDASEVDEEVEVSEYWPGGFDKEGKYYPAGNYPQKRKKKVQKKGTVKSKSFLAPWLAETKEQAEALSTLTGFARSKVPVVAASWFFWQTAFSVDHVPNYSDFLGVKNEKDFQFLIGFSNDPKVIDRGFLTEVAEAVARSTVTGKRPRGIQRFGKVDGDYWRTLDVKNPINQSNPLRLEDNQVQFDASEQYGHLPNGLWAMGLFQGPLGAKPGDRVDSAPDFIAADSTSTNEGDLRVHLPLGCVRCHANGGMRDINGWFRNVLNSPPNFLHNPDYDTLRRLRQKYVSRRLEPYLETSRERYARALMQATGWKPEEYAREYAAFWLWTVDKGVSLDYAARDIGTTPDLLRERFRKVASPPPVGAGTIDPVLATYNLDKPESLALENWYEDILFAHLAFRGVVPTSGKLATRKGDKALCQKTWPNATWIK